MAVLDIESEETGLECKCNLYVHTSVTILVKSLYIRNRSGYIELDIQAQRTSYAAMSIRSSLAVCVDACTLCLSIKFNVPLSISDVQSPKS